ncbi:MAG: hypothetical protein M2R45_00490 [Verrucomicrobia subdivision 3 bacterium]|nr:hypothetical protein [Limisphaerales bacterium]MCS1413632.1 hypothetical protein [Limisphaerales bacterium]
MKPSPARASKKPLQIGARDFIEPPPPTATAEEGGTPANVVAEVNQLKYTASFTSANERAHAPLRFNLTIPYPRG